MKPTPQTTPVLKIERLFNATPERLWKFWTDPKKYAKWLNPAPGLDLVIHEFDVRVGGRVRFDMPQPDGNKNPQEGVFHELDRPRRIVSGDPDKSFLITVDFIPAGQQTRMRVAAIGVPPAYHPMATQGWNQGFDKLERELGTGRVVPRVGGKNEGFTIERVLKAPPRKVYEMWTTRAGLEKWFVPDGWTAKVTKLDVRVGGEYEITFTQGDQTIRNHGTYRTVEPGRRLAWLWKFDIFLAPDEEPYDVPISVNFQEVAGGTKMTFRQGPLATAEHTEGSRQGVMSNFEKLAKALEGAGGGR